MLQIEPTGRLSMDVSGDFNLDDMKKSAGKASALMKTLGHQGRLMILCQLATG